LLYRLSYHGTTHFNLQLCSFTAFSSTRSHRCVRVSEARYSTISTTSVNPLICFQVNDLQLILDSCLLAETLAGDLLRGALYKPFPLSSTA
jgi:hypothetical protein